MAHRQKTPDPHSPMGFRLKHKKVREACTRLLKENGNRGMTSQELLDNIKKVDGKPFSQRQISAKAAGLSANLKKDLRFEADGVKVVTYLTGSKYKAVCWKLNEYGLEYVNNKY